MSNISSKLNRYAIQNFRIDRLNDSIVSNDKFVFFTKTTRIQTFKSLDEAKKFIEGSLNKEILPETVHASGDLYGLEKTTKYNVYKTDLLYAQSESNKYKNNVPLKQKTQEVVDFFLNKESPVTFTYACSFVKAWHKGFIIKNAHTLQANKEELEKQRQNCLNRSNFCKKQGYTKIAQGYENTSEQITEQILNLYAQNKKIGDVSQTLIDLVSNYKVTDNNSKLLKAEVLSSFKETHSKYIWKVTKY